LEILKLNSCSGFTRQDLSHLNSLNLKKLSVKCCFSDDDVDPDFYDGDPYFYNDDPYFYDGDPYFYNDIIKILRGHSHNEHDTSWMISKFFQCKSI